MKQILIAIAFIIPALAASQELKTNFGARPQIFKAGISKFYNSVNNSHEYGYLGSSESGMLTNTRLYAEAMGMINNNDEDDKIESRPRFIGLRAEYDDLLHQSLLSLNYSQNTSCYWNLFGTPLRGYWTIGVLQTSYRSYTGNEISQKSSLGTRASFSGYNKKTGVQADMNFLGKRSVYTLMVTKKVYKHLYASGGIKNNKPMVSFSYMKKASRFDLQISSRFGGLSYTINL